MTTVVVLGGTGEMGERVCRLIRRWVPSALLIATNRSGRGHPEFAVRQADLADRAGMRQLLHEADLLVNAVGPYNYDPTNLVTDCIDARCHYVDLAEDLRFLASVERAARARGAVEAGVTLVPGCSTAPGLIQLLASRWADDLRVERVEARLSMGSRNPVTRALLTGMMAPLGREGPNGARWFRDLAPYETGDGRRLLFGSYPAPFPQRGMRMAGRRLPVRFSMGFDRGWVNRLLAFGAGFLGRLPEGWVPRLAALLLPFVGLARPLGTLRGVLSVEGTDASGERIDRVEVFAKAHGLDIPAAPPVWVAERLVREGTLPTPGVVGLPRAVEADAAIRWLRDAGYDVA